VSLAELGLRPELGDLKQLLVQSFEERLGVELRPVALTAEELDEATRLEEVKYRNDLWNLEGKN
jgi:lipoate-protein ligase A